MTDLENSIYRVRGMKTSQTTAAWANMQYRALTLISIAICIGACVRLSPINFDRDKLRADSSIVEFHRLYNDGKFDQIASMAHPEALRNKDKTALARLLSQVRESYGRNVDAEIVKSDIQARARWREVRDEVLSKFETRAATETFVWYVPDDGIGLFSYEIE